MGLCTNDSPLPSVGKLVDGNLTPAVVAKFCLSQNIIYLLWIYRVVKTMCNLKNWQVYDTKMFEGRILNCVLLGKISGSYCRGFFCLLFILATHIILHLLLKRLKCFAHYQRGFTWRFPQSTCYVYHNTCIEKKSVHSFKKHSSKSKPTLLLTWNKNLWNSQICIEDHIIENFMDNMCLS